MMGKTNFKLKSIANTFQEIRFIMRQSLIVGNGVVQHKVKAGRKRKMNLLKDFFL